MISWTDPDACPDGYIRSKTRFCRAGDTSVTLTPNVFLQEFFAGASGSPCRNFTPVSGASSGAFSPVSRHSPVIRLAAAVSYYPVSTVTSHGPGHITPECMLFSPCSYTVLHFYNDISSLSESVNVFYFIGGTDNCLHVKALSYRLAYRSDS